MPDLAAEAAMTAEQGAVDDHAAADADVAVEVDQVAAADADAAGVLGQGPEIGVVADRHGQAEAEAAGQLLAERHVHRAHVRPEAHDAVTPVDPSGEGRGDPDADRVGPGLAVHLPGEGGQRADDVVQ
nr:hypothetical protein GCM10020093_041250 [Planobispora longispora]